MAWSTLLELFPERLKDPIELYPSLEFDFSVSPTLPSRTSLLTCRLPGDPLILWTQRCHLRFTLLYSTLPSDCSLGYILLCQ